MDKWYVGDMFQSLTPWVPWLGTFSLIMFLGALILLPFIIKRIPSDFFISPGDKKMRHPLVHGLFVIFRNILGLVLLLMGILMLFIPGQGILTILAGLFIMTLPGRKWLLYKIISQKRIQNSLNRFRYKMGEPPFIFPS